VLLRSAAAEDSPGVVWLVEITTRPAVDLGALCDCDFLFHLFPGVPAASIVGGMRFLSVNHLATAGCRYRCCIALFRASLVQVTAPTPHTTGRLRAVSQNMTELPDYNSVSYVTTDSQSASLSWCQAPISGLSSDFYYCQTVACLLM
jgi:hypothetical protein